MTAAVAASRQAVNTTGRSAPPPARPERSTRVAMTAMTVVQAAVHRCTNAWPHQRSSGASNCSTCAITRIRPHTTAIAVVASKLGDLGGLPSGRAGPRSMAGLLPVTGDPRVEPARSSTRATMWPRA
jgi:hypothetical protein